ncbi:MAG: urease accessory protein UreE [Desulfobacterales bacterium]|nr:urease accessory protein UreE [Desulfobacterales bacterium]
MIKLIEKNSQKTHDASTTLTLPYEQRIKSRLRVVLDNGRQAGLFLKRGEILRDKDRLSTDDGYLVEVVAAKEEVSTGHADSDRALCLACYHLGNRHIALEIGDTWVRYLHDHVLDEMVTRLGLRVETGMFPFEPETGAYGQHHHGDHHDGHS